MYRILSCTLTGFNRMLLNNIRQITITPTAPVQLILGINGCGKSSFVNQLSPLPAENEAFAPGGGKVIKIFSEGRQYICTSVKERTMHHSFLMDGEELNPGGTERVQRELCEKHFHVTQQSHDLMRGEDKFTDMNPAKRREWFTRMCDTDYSFAMSAFEKLKERANWLSGAAKMNKKNLVVETAKIMSDAEETKLETEVTELLRELNILTLERMPLGTSAAHHLDERTRALKTLDDVSLKLIRNRVVVPLEYADGRVERDDWGQLKRVYFRSVEEIDTEIDRLKHIVTGREATLVNLHKQFEVYQRQHDLLIRTGSEGVESLNQQIVDLRNQITAKVNSLRIGLIFSDAKAAQTAFEAIEAPLTDVIRELPLNADRRFGRQRYQELEEKSLKLKDQLRGLTEQHQRHVAHREHADLHRGQDKHTCPQCDHSWVVGVNEEQYQKLVDTIKVTEALMKEPTAQHQELLDNMKEIEAYFGQYREVMAYSKSVAILKPFWNYLLESQLLFESPIEAVNSLRYLRQDLNVSVEIEQMEQRIAELEKLKVAAAEVGDAKLDEVRAQMEILSEQLGVLTGELSGVQRAVSNYSDYRRQLQTGIALGEEVKRLYGLAENQQWEHIEALRRESIHQCISNVEQALSLKQESLRSVKAQKALVVALQSQVAKNEVQEQAAKAMVRALSPTHGLIAEGLLGFIRNFVGEMNVFIDRIWTYPLQVIPTGYDNDSNEQSTELDYRFKMVVERESNLVPDISKGSKGIKEMVNMAFKMVALRYLGLTDTPLFLDEFGEGFDEEHRFKATEEVRWMMENGNYPQLFMISHHASNYTSFTNAELCVLDDRNIALPSGKEYNKQVTINH